MATGSCSCAATGTKSSPSAPRPCNQMMLCRGSFPDSRVMYSSCSGIYSGRRIRFRNDIAQHLKYFAETFRRLGIRTFLVRVTNQAAQMLHINFWIRCKQFSQRRIAFQQAFAPPFQQMHMGSVLLRISLPASQLGEYGRGVNIAHQFADILYLAALRAEFVDAFQLVYGTA